MAGLFGGGQSAAATPTPDPPKPPPPMPDAMSPLVLEERRRKVAQIMARGGRSSTILTANDGPYSTPSLG